MLIPFTFADLDAGGKPAPSAGSAPEPRRVTFAISTDDPVRIGLNGREVYDTATRAAQSLDEILAQQRDGTRRSYEFQFSGDAVAGYNDLSVFTCRAGHAWGFFLRIINR